MEIIAVIRDISIISVLLVAMLVMLLLFWKVSSVLKSAKRTMDSVSEVTATVADKLVKPATASSGVATGAGRVLGFVLGLAGRKKRKGGEGDG